MTRPIGLKRHAIIFASGILVGMLILAAVAWFWGPRTMVQEEDPITGRFRTTHTWLGMTMSSTIAENETSAWADQYLPEGMYRAQYGWNHVTSTGRSEWFGHTYIACGGGYGVVQAICSGEAIPPGMKRQDALRQYLRELVAEYQAHGSIRATQEKWSPYRSPVPSPP